MCLAQLSGRRLHPASPHSDRLLPVWPTRLIRHCTLKPFIMSARDTEPPTPPPPKKVRIACRRCRAKRIKVGHVHAAKVICAFADTPGSVMAALLPAAIAREPVFLVLMSMAVIATSSSLESESSNYFSLRANFRCLSFMTQCCARIRWLEQQIRILDPDFDLTQGPSMNGAQVDLSSHSSPGIPDHNNPPGMSETLPQNHDKQPTLGKRTYDSVEGLELDRPLPAEASSVANVLGMLSLHSDSRQQHYMGSSSGLLFTKLIGAGKDTQATSHIPRTEITYGGRSSASQLSTAAYNSLYRTLAKV